MLFINNNPAYLCNGLLMLMAFIVICAGYAYRVNARLPQNDPKKRNFHFGAVLLAPITLPFFLLASLTIFVLRVFVYVVFLMLVTIALIAFRKPFLFIWLDKIATMIGNILLETNTFLMKIVFGKKLKSPETL